MQEIHRFDFNQQTLAGLDVSFIGLHIKSGLILLLGSGLALAWRPGSPYWFSSVTCQPPLPHPRSLSALFVKVAFVSVSPEAEVKRFLSAFSHLTGHSLAGVLVPCVSNLKQAFPVGHNLGRAAQVPQRRLH